MLDHAIYLVWFHLLPTTLDLRGRKIIWILQLDNANGGNRTQAARTASASATYYTIASRHVTHMICFQSDWMLWNWDVVFNMMVFSLSWGSSDWGDGMNSHSLSLIGLSRENLDPKDPHLSCLFVFLFGDGAQN